MRATEAAPAALAQALEVDVQTLRLRVDRLTSRDRRVLRAC
jgi:hypothetical protein